MKVHKHFHTFKQVIIILSGVCVMFKPTKLPYIVASRLNIFKLIFIIIIIIFLIMSIKRTVYGGKQYLFMFTYIQERVSAEFLNCNILNRIICT